MANPITPWFPATARERRDLANAITNNCECHAEPDGFIVRCASHTMVLAETPADRRTLEGLLYVRRTLLPRLRAEEFSDSRSSAENQGTQVNPPQQ